MPNDPGQERSTAIERTINRDIADALTMTPHGGSVFTVAPRSMGELLEFAKLMSVSGICIRPMFRGNPGACLALTLQAMKWGADPFAVANKAFEVNGQLSYESQLIHAIVNSSPALARRLNATFIGEGQARQCVVTGVIKGESEAREYQSPKLSEITPKNSPLWKTDPDQQLFYYSTRAWARRWVPEVLLGINTPDEIGRTIELVPAEEPRREDFVEIAKLEPIDDRPVYTVVDLDGVEHEFREVGTYEAALARVLAEAERQGPERLNGARESNGLPPLAPEPPPAPKRERRAAPPAPAPEPEPAAPAPQPWPFDPPEQQDSPAAQQQPERIVTDGLGGPAAAGDTNDQALVMAQDQLEQNGEPQNDDPERGSLEIAPPIRRGRPDYRTWMIALLLPKVRQAQDTSALSFLLSDNDEHLTKARANLSSDDLATLEEAIATRWKELG